MRRLAWLTPLALAACGQPAGVEVADAWARDTVGRTATAAVFMTLSSGTPDRLIGASTPAAAKTDLMTMETGAGGTMAMAYLDAIEIPSGTPVVLAPTGLHVWLEDLAAPLEAGATIPLTLEFENAGEKQVRVAIVGPAAEPPTGM